MDIKNYIFVCVGDGTVMFDCLGCVVGDILKHKNLPAFVFGGTNFPITTKNIKIVVEQIKINFPNQKIIIIDCTCVNNTNSNCLKSGNKNNAIGSTSLFNTKELLNQEICLNKGAVTIANINYECGDYNMLCKTFELENNKIKSLNFKEVLLLSYKVVNKIFEIFNV